MAVNYKQDIDRWQQLLLFLITITVIILKWCFYERILHDWRSFYSTKRFIFFMQIYDHAGL